MKGNTERTLVIIKPEGIEKRLVGKVIARIESLSLRIVQMQWKKITAEECDVLYSKTKDNLPEIFAAVAKYMTASFSIIFVVEGENAVKKVRTLRGPTDLLNAPKGTVRRDFVTDQERELFRQGKNIRNVMHAADDETEARTEMALFFGKGEG